MIRSDLFFITEKWGSNNLANQPEQSLVSLRSFCRLHCQYLSQNASFNLIGYFQSIAWWFLSDGLETMNMSRSNHLIWQCLWILCKAVLLLKIQIYSLFNMVTSHVNQAVSSCLSRQVLDRLSCEPDLMLIGLRLVYSSHPFFQEIMFLNRTYCVIKIGQHIYLWEHMGKGKKHMSVFQRYVVTFSQSELPAPTMWRKCVFCYPRCLEAGRLLCSLTFSFSRERPPCHSNVKHMRSPHHRRLSHCLEG